LLPDGNVHSAFAGYARDFRGANRQLQAVRNYSVATASCLLTRRELLHRTLPGFPTETASPLRARFLPVGLPGRRVGPYEPEAARTCAAVEFCLTLREQRLRTVSVPYAELRRTSKKE